MTRADGTTTAETRRHFEVVGESLRGVAEAVVLLGERMDRRDHERARLTDALGVRVTRLEGRVSALEDQRKLRRPRRAR